MIEPSIITFSSVPEDIPSALQLKEKIDNGLVIPHPDQHAKIMAKLNLVLSGKHIGIAEKQTIEPHQNTTESQDEIGITMREIYESMGYSAEAIEEAKEREKKRDKIRQNLKAILESISHTENEATLQNLKYSHQKELSAAKLSILKILTNLDRESESPNERNLRQLDSY